MAKNTDEISSQDENVPETFEDLLAYHDARREEGWVDNPARKEMLAYVARLEARQITPDIVALYTKLQAGRRAEFSEDEAFLYPGEQHRVMEEIVLALGKMIEGGE